MDELSLNTIYSVSNTKEEGVYLAFVNLTDLHGETYDCEYLSREGDPFGLAPTIRQAIMTWIEAGSPVDPYVEPTVEELRAALQPLSPASFRSALIDYEIMPDQVTAAINEIADEKEKAKAMTYWEYATQFERGNSLMQQIASTFDLTDEQIDDMWNYAMETYEISK